MIVILRLQIFSLHHNWFFLVLFILIMEANNVLLRIDLVQVEHIWNLFAYFFLFVIELAFNLFYHFFMILIIFTLFNLLEY